MDELTRDERLRLMKFVCSFAWADLRIRPEERAAIGRLARRLHLDAEEKRMVEGWLAVPPPADEVDPQRVPREHRELFLRTIWELIAADGEIDPAEAENYELFAALLR